MPFPLAAVAQSKFLRLPLLFMLHSLEYITFPNWVFLVAHVTGTITFPFCDPEELVELFPRAFPTQDKPCSISDAVTQLLQ